MKKLVNLLLFSAAISLCGGCNQGEESMEPKPVDVVVISGQSNAVGCTKVSCISRSIGHSKYQEYLAGYEHIQIAFDSWTKDVTLEGSSFYSQNKSKDNTFMKVMLGQGNSLATFGPEIGIAESMHEKYADRLFIIKYACGASNLKDDWATKDSPMYGRFINYVKLQMKNLEDMGYVPTIKAFCWMQGEGDSYPGYHEYYYENLKGFVGSVREDLKELSGNSDVPFIDALVNNVKDQGQYRWPNWKEVNDAKKQFAAESENNFCIDTIEKGLHSNQEPFDEPDLAHYDSESQVLLGNLFAEQFEQFLTKE